MQMYVNYFDRHVRTEMENHTIGIVLCKKKNSALVEITLPKTPTSTLANTSSTCQQRRIAKKACGMDTRAR